MTGVDFYTALEGVGDALPVPPPSAIRWGRDAVFPTDQAGPFSRLTGTWIALAAAVMTTLGLFAIAVRTHRVGTTARDAGVPPTCCHASDPW
jgi:hypothetical protein